MSLTLPNTDAHRHGEARQKGKGGKDYRSAHSYTKAFPDPFGPVRDTQQVTKPDVNSDTSSTSRKSQNHEDSSDDEPMKGMLWQAFLDSWNKANGSPKPKLLVEQASEVQGTLADAAKASIVIGSSEEPEYNRGRDGRFRKSSSITQIPQTAQQPPQFDRCVVDLEDDSDDATDTNVQNVYTFPPTPPSWLSADQKKIWRARQQRACQIREIMDANRKPITGWVDGVEAVAAWNSMHGWKPDYQKYGKYSTLKSRMSKDRNLLRELMKEPGRT